MPVGMSKKTANKYAAKLEALMAELSQKPETVKGTKSCGRLPKSLKPPADWENRCAEIRAYSDAQTYCANRAARDWV